MCRALRSLPVILLWMMAAKSLAAERVVLVAGGGQGGEGSPATEARLQAPFGVVFDRAENLYFVELTGQRVGCIKGNGILTTIAGSGAKGNRGDHGPARDAEFNGPHSLAIAPNGDLYIADTWNNRVRKIDARTKRITNFAGTGEKGFSGDGGPATQAKFGGVYCIAFEPSFQRLYLADLDNRRIRAVDVETGVVTIVAGNGEKGVPKDGEIAVFAPLVDPRAVAVGQDSIYVLERGGHALRVVGNDGRIRTVVGTGERGSGGDGGDARQARLNGPKHLCLDREGNVIIADTENHLIRKYLPREGRIVRIAGTGKKGTVGVGGPPEQVELNQPHGVYVHPSGVLYIADSSNNRILRIESQ